MALNNIVNEGCLTRDTRKIINDNFTDVALCTTELDATSNATLANVPGMVTGILQPGTYRFYIALAGTAGASGGWKVAFNYGNGLTLTSLEATGIACTAAATAVTHTTTTTTQTSLIADTAAVIYGEIVGTMVVATAGTVQVQFAQNASNATASSIYKGSHMEFTPVGATAPSNQ